MQAGYRCLCELPPAYHSVLETWPAQRAAFASDFAHSAKIKAPFSGALLASPGPIYTIAGKHLAAQQNAQVNKHVHDRHSLS